MRSDGENSLISYARACVSIHLQAHARKLERPFRGVECVLCEDGITAMIYVPADPEWIAASFVLPARIEESEFDPQPYLEGFERCESE